MSNSMFKANHQAWYTITIKAHNKTLNPNLLPVTQLHIADWNSCFPEQCRHHASTTGASCRWQSMSTCHYSTQEKFEMTTILLSLISLGLTVISWCDVIELANQNLWYNDNENRTSPCPCKELQSPRKANSTSKFTENIWGSWSMFKAKLSIKLAVPSPSALITKP